MSKPRLLFLAHILPYPPDSGVTIRTFNIFRVLASEFEIELVCFYRRSAHGDEASARAAASTLEEHAERVDVFPIPQEYRRSLLLLDHFRSVLRGRPYTHDAYLSERFRDHVQARLANGAFDLVHVDSLDLLAYLPLLGGHPLVCVHHNVESQLVRRRAAKDTNPLRRHYLYHQARLLEEAERRWCPRVDLNVAVSDQDRETFEDIAPGADFIVVPNGVDVERFRMEPTDDPGAVVFLGGTEWFPNVDALDFFCSDVLPRIRDAGEDPEVRWVGRSTEEEQRSYREKYGVHLTGYVDSIKPHVQDAACTVVPLRIGGGTRLKITTAWAMGRAIVSTSLGCEGLDARDGENILVRDDPAGFASAVVALLRDADLRRSLEAGGRHTAEHSYAWDVVTTEMLDAYGRLAGRGPS